MKELFKDVLVKLIIDCMAKLRYRLMRAGLDSVSQDLILVALVHESDSPVLWERTMRKVKRNRDSVRKSRFNKKAEGWVCPDSPDKLK